MTDTECEHDYELTGIDPNAGGSNARMAKFRCLNCSVEQQLLTTKTDAQIEQALAEAKAGA